MVQIYGHRGSRAFAPENTIPSFSLALNAGVDFLDMDVVVTKDNILVAYHDLWLNPDITIYADKFIEPLDSKLVKDLTFSQLQSYSIGLNLTSNYAKFFPQQKNIPQVKIPSVQQVIDYAESIVQQSANHRSIQYQIEVKTDPENPSYSLGVKDLAELVYKILVTNNIVERAEIQGFDWHILLELQKLDSRIRTAYLVSNKHIVSMYKDDWQLAKLYHAGYLLKDFDYMLPKMVKKFGGSCYEPEDVALTKTDLDLAHDLGLKVVVWRYPEMSGSIFDMTLANKLIGWGVDGLILDDPTSLESCK